MIRIEFATPDFFKLPPKALAIECEDFTGRTYFLYRGAIVAVARSAT